LFDEIIWHDCRFDGGYKNQLLEERGLPLLVLRWAIKPLF